LYFDKINCDLFVKKLKNIKLKHKNMCPKKRGPPIRIGGGGGGPPQIGPFLLE